MKQVEQEPREWLDEWGVDEDDLADLFAGDITVTSPDGLADFMVVDTVFFVHDNEAGEWHFFDHTADGIGPEDFDPGETDDDEEIGRRSRRRRRRRRRRTGRRRTSTPWVLGARQGAQKGVNVARGTGNFWMDLISTGYNIVAEPLSQIPDERFQEGFTALDRTLRPEHHAALDAEKEANQREANQRDSDTRDRIERHPRERYRRTGRPGGRPDHFGPGGPWPPGLRPGGRIVLKPSPEKYTVQTTVLGFLATRYAMAMSGQRSLTISGLGGDDFEVEF